MKYLPNIVVAFSNLIFLAFARNKTNIHWIAFFPMVFSFVYHLAEVKHHLVGFPILNQYADTLLFIDRLGAIGASLFMIIQVYNNHHLFIKLIPFGIIGFMALAYSEMDIITNRTLSNIEYIISHSIWHYCAMKCFSYCFV